jgi:L-2-hydroxyglutarate oxidase LhgO
MAAAVECVVIGAGVVGLACARLAAQRGLEVVVLEAEHMIGSVTSARNSEVVHAGIYYPAGSNKAKMCVRGRDMLYEYCESHGVPYKRCGKLIVATSPEEVETLEGIRRKAEANGVTDLRRLSGEEATAMEPELRCEAALLSPSTGIVDSHAFMLALQGDAEAAGAMVALSSPVVGGAVTDTGEILLRTGGPEPMELLATHVINCAGLTAPRIARALVSDAGAPADASALFRGLELPDAFFAKGNYYALQDKAPFRRLVYPVPQQAGLGVHGTVDLGGQMRFGPDVEWVRAKFEIREDAAAQGSAAQDAAAPDAAAPDAAAPDAALADCALADCGLDYDVDPARAESFYAEVRKYWPGLRDGTLVPDYSGVRPKICPEGAPAADFVVWAGKDYAGAAGTDGRDLSGLVNLFGIESPGLTSSLALAEAAVEALSGAKGEAPA